MQPIRQVHAEERRKRDELRDTITTLERSLKSKTSACKKQETEIFGLQTAFAEKVLELSNVSARLLNHPNPIVRQNELDRLHVIELQGINASKDKKIEGLERQMSYFQQAYQDASSAAAEAPALRDENELLKEELARLTEVRKNEMRARRDRSALVWQPLVDAKKVLSADNERLKADNSRLYDANLELKRGRAGVQTRGSSVQPAAGGRSPRGGSRGVSPAVTGMPGGLAPGVGAAAMGRTHSGLGPQRHA